MAKPTIPQQLRPQPRQQTISEIKRSKQKETLKIAVPSQPTQTIPTEASQLKEGKRQVVEIDKIIKKLEAEASQQDLKYNQAKTVSRAESADNRRVMLRARVAELKSVKSFAKTGKYDLNSIIGYAQEVANARFERIRPRSSAEVLQQRKFDEQVKEQKRIYQEQLKEFNKQVEDLKKQGINPVIRTTDRGREVVGFEDTKTGMSYDAPIQTPVPPTKAQALTPGISAVERQSSFYAPEHKPDSKFSREVGRIVTGIGEQIDVVSKIPSRSASFLYGQYNIGETNKRIGTIVDTGIGEQIDVVSKIPQRVGDFLYKDIDEGVKLISYDIGRFGSAVIDPFTKIGKPKKAMTPLSREKKARTISSAAETILFAPRDKQKEIVIAGGIGLGFGLVGGAATGLGTGAGFASEVVGVGLGSLYAADTAIKYSQTPKGSKERGELIGGTAVELTSFGFGARAGSAIAKELSRFEKSKALADKMIKKQDRELAKLKEERSKISVLGEKITPEDFTISSASRGTRYNPLTGTSTSSEIVDFKGELKGKSPEKITLFGEPKLTEKGKIIFPFKKEVKLKPLSKDLFPGMSKKIKVKTGRPGRPKEFQGGFEEVGEYTADISGRYISESKGDASKIIGKTFQLGSGGKEKFKESFLGDVAGEYQGVFRIRPARKSKRIVKTPTGNAIIDIFPEGRITGVEYTKVKPTGQIKGDSGLILTGYKAETRFQDIKPRRTSLKEEMIIRMKEPDPKLLKKGFEKSKPLKETIGIDISGEKGPVELTTGEGFITRGVGISKRTKQGQAAFEDIGFKDTTLTPKKLKPSTRKTEPESLELFSGGEQKTKLELAKKSFEPPTPKKFAIEKPTPTYVGGAGGVLSRGSYTGLGSIGSIGATSLSSVPNIKGNIPLDFRGSITGAVIGLGLKDKSKIDSKSDSFQDNILDSSLESTKPTITDLVVPNLFTPQSTKLGQPLQPRLSQPQVPRLAQPTITQFESPSFPTIPFPPRSPPEKDKPKPKMDLFFRLLPPKDEGFRQIRTEGYNVSVKEKGKFKKVNTKPYTRSGAMDLGARTVDNTINATWKISKVKKTVTKKGKKKQVPKLFNNKDLLKGDDYFNRTKVKYRPYKVRKGKKVPLPNKWIERRGKRADTRGEQQGLSIAKLKAQGRRNRFRL